MKKINKLNLVLAIGIVLILVYIVFDSNKIDTRVSEDDDGNKSIVSEELLATIKKQEHDYQKNIEQITGEYQILLDTLDKKLETDQDDNSMNKGLLTKNEVELVAKLADDMTNMIVPKKFKNYHLLFSRSIMQLSIYSESLDPANILEGLQLFNEAKKEFDNLAVN